LSPNFALQIFFCSKHTVTVIIDTQTQYWFLQPLKLATSNLVRKNNNNNNNIIIIIKNECHSNIIVNRLQGCSHRKKNLRESESESSAIKLFERCVVSCKNARRGVFFLFKLEGCALKFGGCNPPPLGGSRNNPGGAVSVVRMLEQFSFHAASKRWAVTQKTALPLANCSTHACFYIYFNHNNMYTVK